MNHLVTDNDNLTYNPIPFMNCISNGPIHIFLNSKTIEHREHRVSSKPRQHIKPIKHNMSITKTVGLYTFTEDELTMNVINFHRYVKLNSWESDKVKALSLARRRYNNCIYSRRARSKRKNNKNNNNNTKKSKTKTEIHTGSNTESNTETKDQIIYIEKHPLVEQENTVDRDDTVYLEEELPDLIHYKYNYFYTKLSGIS